MKIYIASRWSQRHYLHDIRSQLSQMQHQVVSSWLDEVDENDFGADHAFHRRLATRDLIEIATADLLLLDESIELSQGSGGGREVEYGFALAQFQFTRCWLIGTPRNPFHYLAEQIFTTWEDCLDYVKGI